MTKERSQSIAGQVSVRDSADGIHYSVGDDNPMPVVMGGVDIEGNAQGQLSVSGVAAQTATLALGMYDLWSAAECYIKVDAVANDVTTSTGYILYPNNVVSVFVDEGRKIGAITAGETGTLRYFKVA